MIDKPDNSNPQITLNRTIALVVIAGVLTIWEIIVRLSNTPIYILPAPSRILITLFSNPETYFNGTLITLSEAILGLILGTVAGTAAALLLGIWPRMEQGVMTIAILIKSTPLVAVAPLLTIWLGFGVLPKIIITALLTFFPVLVNLLSGLQSTDPALLDIFRSWNATRMEQFINVRSPHALPYLFAALKVSGPLALIGAVVAEWTGASGGLGRIMWLAYANLNLPLLFAAVFILASAGMVIYSLTVWLERRILFWEYHVID
jgi:ABC-type nitrate/sulfonate/bicarbonate transport system permease component